MNFTMQQLLNKITLSLSLLLAAFLWAGCEVINPEEPKPAFVHIDSFTFIKPPENLGTGLQKITSVWAYFNGKPLGAFDLPANIPVVTTTPGTLQLVPGITYSALNNYQEIYPFFLSDTATIQPGSSTALSPVTTYISDALLTYWKFNFDVANEFSKLGGDTGIERVTDPSLVLEGQGSGYIYLRSPQTTSSNISAPFSASGNAYLELNYKSTMPLVIGVGVADPDQGAVTKYLIGLNPSKEWNKAYVGLSTITGAYPGQNYYLILNSNLESGSEGYVLVDNIKVISLK